jgi:aminocarboxymuconate-semialdehyde decarboxylase
MEFTAYGPTGAREHGGVSKQLPANLKTVDAHAHLWIDAAQKIAAPFLKDIVIPLERYTSDATKIANKKHYDERSHYLKNIELRIEDMDARNIDIQAVIPVPKQSYYWIPIEPAKEALRAINEGVAAAVKTAPDRFVGFGAIPMQDVDAALKEMEYCVNQLGFKGIQILTNINGEEISIPKFDPIWAKAQELDVLIFLHPDGFTQGERLAEHYFINVLGNPMDTTIAVHHLIFKGVLERYPQLRILLAHGGGFLPGYSGRMDHAWSARADAHGDLPHPPTTYLKKLYFDTCVFTHHQLKYLVDVYGADHIMMGTDYPFDMAEFRPIEHILETPGLSDDEIAALVSGNAHTHLKLTDR